MSKPTYMNHYQTQPFPNPCDNYQSPGYFRAEAVAVEEVATLVMALVFTNITNTATVLTILSMFANSRLVVIPLVTMLRNPDIFNIWQNVTHTFIDA